MKYKEQDLTAGNVPRQLIAFGMPLFIANLLQSLYSIVDMLVVGNVVGSSGLAAVSNASMISFIINSVCMGLTGGGTVLAAQYKGAGDQNGQKETISTLFVISAVSSVIVTLAGLMSYQAVFEMLRVPQEAMKDACDYMFIICCGTVCVFGYNAVCAVMRGLGDSKTPLYFVAAAAAVNVILDFLLVGILGMGTKGAAWATVFSQGTSFVFSVIYLRKKQFVFDFRLDSFILKIDKMAGILKVGVPSAVQLAVVNISYLIITGMLNVYGVDVAAASGIGLKVNTFAGMPCWAAGQAVTAMVGQNMGAGRTERVKKITLAGLALSTGTTLLSVGVIQIFAEPIISLFDPVNPAVLENGVLYLRICCSVNSLVYAAMYTFDSFATGVGAASLAMFNSLLDSVVVRLLAGWLLGTALGLGFLGIYIGQAVSPVLSVVVGAVFFKSGCWEKRKMIR